jgi:uncharacterized RDD family membrane protein YckC
MIEPVPEPNREPGIEPAPAPAPTPVPTSGWIVPEVRLVGPAPGYAFAGFWRRFVAYLVDWLILAVPLGLLAVPLFNNLDSIDLRAFVSSLTYDPVTRQYIADPAALARLEAGLDKLLAQLLLVAIAALVVQFLYFGVFWSSRSATLGQELLGVQVRDEATGSRISFGRGCLRYIGYLVSAFFFDIGFIWIAFDGRKQGWHDKIASTVAIRQTGPRTRPFPYWILAIVIVFAVIGGAGFSVAVDRAASIIPPVPGSGAGIAPENEPPLGTIWFGLSYDESDFSLTGQSTTFPRATSVALVASLNREIHYGEVVSTYTLFAGGDRLISTYRFPDEGSVLAQYTDENVLNCTCALTFEIRDSNGAVLARGTILLT